ncbi:MAG: radical SAM family heme chaperone HemW [Proteobacteria bacterium]|nr:radical SAM family heme chaperone HemW [Pseudomonadota bacterium]
MNPLPPLTLYVHLPWCVQKCPYCDFNSHALKETLPEQAYLAALSRDLDFAVAELDAPRPLEAVFFGGGTPSLFSAEGIGRLIEHVSRSLPLDKDVEITLEANPGTIERGRFADYREAGINRVSLGVQSFDDAQLKTLGRIHDASAARRAIEELHAAGLENFNIDLMFGLPGQGVPAALADIEQAIAAKPAHISHYELTMEPNTLFAVRPPANLPDDELAVEIAGACRERLVEAGFHRYEISAWSMENRASRHNLNYWRFGDYLAIGAGAHGKLTASGGRITRSARHRHPRDYQAQAGGEMAVAERREIGPEDCVLEYMLNNSRLVEGGHPAAFTQLTGLDAERWLMPGIRRGLALGLLQHRSDGGWQPTPRGLEMLNDLQGLFLPEAPGEDSR